MNKVIESSICKLFMRDNVAVVLKFVGNIIEGIKDFDQKSRLDAGFDVFLNGYVVFHMGRSFLVLVTFPRKDVSQFLSMRFCGSGAVERYPSGQGRKFAAGFNALFQKSHLLYQVWSSALSFEIYTHTLLLRDGRGVDASPSFICRRVKGEASWKELMERR